MRVSDAAGSCARPCRTSLPARRASGVAVHSGECAPTQSERVARAGAIRGHQAAGQCSSPPRDQPQRHRSTCLPQVASCCTPFARPCRASSPAGRARNSRQSRHPASGRAAAAHCHAPRGRAAERGAPRGHREASRLSKAGASRRTTPNRYRAAPSGCVPRDTAAPSACSPPSARTRLRFHLVPPVAPTRPTGTYTQLSTLPGAA